MLTEIALKLRSHSGRLIAKNEGLDVCKTYQPSWLYLLRERVKQTIQSR